MRQNSPEQFLSRVNRPLERALRLGEALFDYVLTRFKAVQELAEMTDEANYELREAVRAVLHVSNA